MGFLQWEMREEEQQVRKISHKLCPRCYVCAIRPDGNGRQKIAPKIERRRCCWRECKVRNHGTTSTTTEKKKERWSKDTQGRRRKSLEGSFLFQLRKREKKSVPTKAEHCGIPQHFFFAVLARNKSHPHTLDPLLIFPTITGLGPLLKNLQRERFLNAGRNNKSFSFKPAPGAKKKKGTSSSSFYL